MEFQGMTFTVNALTSMAVVCVMFGVALVVIEMGNRLDESFHATGRVSKWMISLWRQLADCSWHRVPALAISGFASMVAKSINYWFGQSEKNVITSGLFFFLVLVAIPVAAAINYLRGGSEFLLELLIVSLLLYICLLIFGEIKAMRWLASAISVFLFGVIFLFVPSYVFTSFNGLVLAAPTGHAAIGSLLMTPLLYLICHSVVLCGVGMLIPLGATTSRQLFTAFIASLPLAYLLSYGAFLFGHFAATSQPAIQDRRLLMFTVLFTGVSIAVTHFLFSPSKERGLSHGRMLAALVGLIFLAGICSVFIVFWGIPAFQPDQIANIFFGLSREGDAGLLGPVFWVMHLPYFPVVVIALVAMAALLAKILVALDAVVFMESRLQQYPLAGGGAVFIVGGISAMGALLW